MNNTTPGTNTLKLALNEVGSKSEGLAYLKDNIDPIPDKTLSAFFDEYFLMHPELVRAQVIKDSEISRSYAHEILNGTKNGSRDRIIALCFAANMSLDDTNHALIYSGNSSLYPKNSRDAYIILAINLMKAGSSDITSVAKLNEYLYENNLAQLNLSKD